MSLMITPLLSVYNLALQETISARENKGCSSYSVRSTTAVDFWHSPISIITQAAKSSVCSSVVERLLAKEKVVGPNPTVTF